MERAPTRRRLSAAVFILICAPCFVGFLVFVLPAVAGALAGSLLLSSSLGAVVGGAAGMAYMVWRRQKRLREAAATAGDRPSPAPAAKVNAPQR